MAAPVKSPSPATMTVTEVCEFLQIHRSTLYRLLKMRAIPAFRVGSDWRFSHEAIEQWSRSQERKSTH
jgi:excisionase family DNA binding protein